MVIIEINKNDKEKVFEVLINNGLFRALDETKFDLVENVDEILEKLSKKSIKVKVIEKSDCL